MGYQELNATNINLKDFDLQITLTETTENTGHSFRYNIHITKDICTTYVDALWYYYSASTSFKISNKYQKFSQDYLMICTIIKTKSSFFLAEKLKMEMTDRVTVSCSVCLHHNLLSWR